MKELSQSTLLRLKQRTEQELETSLRRLESKSPINLRISSVLKAEIQGIKKAIQLVYTRVEYHLT